MNTTSPVLARRTLASILLGAFACLALLASVPAAKAQDIDPGLWELSTEMDSPDGSSEIAKQMAAMQEQLKNLPPEARAMLEQTMASAGMGVGLADGKVSVRVCVSPEDARSGPIREGQKEGDCTYTKVEQRGNTWQGRMVCTDPAMRGDFTTTLHNRGHHSTTANLRGAKVGNLTMKVDGRRLGADCAGL